MASNRVLAKSINMPFLQSNNKFIYVSLLVVLSFFLLLDYVLSELDARRQDFVLNQIRSGQVLITCCEPERITNIGKRIFVEGGQIRGEASCT